MDNIKEFVLSRLVKLKNERDKEYRLMLNCAEGYDYKQADVHRKRYHVFCYARAELELTLKQAN